MLLSQQNTENEQKTKKTNHRLTRIPKQVTIDLVDRYILSKKQRKSFNAPLYVLNKNLNSNENSQMRKRLTAVFPLPKFRAAKPTQQIASSSEASQTFGHANANLNDYHYSFL